MKQAEFVEMSASRSEEVLLISITVKIRAVITNVSWVTQEETDFATVVHCKIAIELARCNDKIHAHSALFFRVVEATQSEIADSQVIED